MNGTKSLEDLLDVDVLMPIPLLLREMQIDHSTRLDDSYSELCRYPSTSRPSDWRGFTALHLATQAPEMHGQEPGVSFLVLQGPVKPSHFLFS